MLNALHYLHTKNIVHLDLKPENLLLDTADKIVRLIDFGSAQEIRPKYPENLTDSKIEASPEFLAPEVISNGPVGTYTDMWCFGVLLYVSLRYEKVFLLLERPSLLQSQAPGSAISNWREPKSCLDRVKFKLVSSKNVNICCNTKNPFT